MVGKFGNFHRSQLAGKHHPSVLFFHSEKMAIGNQMNRGLCCASQLTDEQRVACTMRRGVEIKLACRFSRATSPPRIGGGDGESRRKLLRAEIASAKILR